MKCFLFVLVGLITVELHAQSFFQSFSGNDYDEAHGIVQHSDSSYFICGSSSSFNAASNQAFLMKMTKDGIFEWSKEYGGSETEIAKRVLNCGDTALYLIGTTNSTVSGDYDCFISKTSLDGTQVFQKTLSNVGWDKVNDAIIGTDSMIYIVGEAAKTGKGTECYLLKLTLAGDTVWTKTFGSIGDDGLNAIKQLDDSTFFAVGTINTTDSVFTKGLVLKFNDLGQISWQKEVGPNGNYTLTNFILADQKIKAVGTHKHTLGDLDSWLLRMDLSGIVEESLETHDQGDLIHEGIALLGDAGKFFISNSYKNQYSASNSWDNGYERYSGDFTWDNVGIYVTMMYKEKGNQIISTLDKGIISVGSITSNSFGGSLAFAIKIGSTSTTPIINLSNTQSILAVNQLEIPSFLIYPNPTNEMVSVRSKHSGIIEVYSNIGELIEVIQTSGEIQLNCNNYLKGLYFVRLFDGVSQATQKLVIE